MDFDQLCHKGLDIYVIRKQPDKRSLFSSLFYASNLPALAVE